MVSGATRAPCYLLAAAAYISPGYNPSPKLRPDEGDPAVLCTSHMGLTRKGNKGKIHKMEAVKVDRVNVNVPLGEPPLYSVNHVRSGSLPVVPTPYQKLQLLELTPPRSSR